MNANEPTRTAAIRRNAQEGGEATVADGGIPKQSSSDRPLVAKTDVIGSGPPLVLVPGGLTGMSSWEQHAQELAGDRTVIRSELLNVEMGLRGLPLPADYSVALESAALGRALDELAVTQADFIGWSFGGQVALELALHHPQRVRTLILIEPPAWSILDRRSEYWTQAQAFERMMSAYGPEDVSEDQLADFLHGADIVPRSVDPRSNPSWPVWIRYRQSLRCGVTPSRHQIDVGRLRRFDRPVLVFKGEGSAGYMREAMDRLALELPNARLEELPGAHVLPMVSMERFLALVREFIG